MKSMILAVDMEGGIGKDGGLPWPHLSINMQRFRKITMQYDRVIMGRRTWDSLLKKPLQGRHNVVITRWLDTSKRLEEEGAHEVWGSFKELKDGDIVIGGAGLYQRYASQADRVYLTRVHATFDADTHFITHAFDGWHVARHSPMVIERGYTYDFMILERPK